MAGLSRRGFIGGVSALALGGCATSAGKSAATAADAAEKAPPLIASEPCLQAPGPDTMGVVFALGDTANGFVDYGEKADLSDARRVKCGGLRVTGWNDRVAQVRLTGLKPATRYYYRIGAWRISYKGGYAMKRLEETVSPAIHSFTTAGEKAESRFCVMNDTHARWDAFKKVTDKVAELAPPVCIWNGDASNTSETIEDAVSIFLTPEKSPAYAADVPVLFENGNHDFRGRFNALELDKVAMTRLPSERDSRFWDLPRNVAYRQGDVALIGLDTGEDKLDTNPLFAGLFNMAPYRELQTEWLKEQFKRPEIASAPYVVAFCHIPLFDANPRANPGDVAPADKDPKYTHDFALWQRTCAKMWGPVFAENKVQLVIAAHEHCYRYDAPTADRPWAQIVGGGPHLDFTWDKKPVAENLFPTVIEGKVDGGKLQVLVHDVRHGTVCARFAFAPRA